MKCADLLLGWRFKVSYTSIPIDKVAFECERIESAQFEWLKTSTCSKVLARLYDLPAEMKQIPSKNSIVILERTENGSRVLKFTPRVQERDWLNEIRGAQADDSARWQ